MTLRPPPTPHADRLARIWRRLPPTRKHRKPGPGAPALQVQILGVYLAERDDWAPVAEVLDWATRELQGSRQGAWDWLVRLAEVGGARRRPGPAYGPRANCVRQPASEWRAADPG